MYLSSILDVVEAFVRLVLYLPPSTLRYVADAEAFVAYAVAFASPALSILKLPPVIVAVGLLCVVPTAPDSDLAAATTMP